VSEAVCGQMMVRMIPLWSFIFTCRRKEEGGIMYKPILELMSSSLSRKEK
jgi:hypothetical protein